MTFEARFEAIRKASIEQGKSVNIDVRAYHGEWVAGVAGVQIHRSNSFLEIVQSIEDTLGIRQKTRFNDLNDAAKKIGYVGVIFGVDHGGHFLIFKHFDLATEMFFQDREEDAVFAQAEEFVKKQQGELQLFRTAIEEHAARSNHRLGIVQDPQGIWRAGLNGGQFQGTLFQVLMDLAKEMHFQYPRER